LYGIDIIKIFSTNFVVDNEVITSVSLCCLKYEQTVANKVDEMWTGMPI